MVLGKPDLQMLNHLQNAQSIYPEHKELLDFYEKLFQVQFAFKSDLHESGRYAELHRQTVNLSRLSEGSPQVIFKELKIDQAEFIQFFTRMVELIKDYIPGQEGIYAGITAEAALGLAQNIFESRNPVILSEAPVNVALVAAGFALMPYLQIAGELIMPLIDQSLWQRNYCPVCGGKPSFAALDKESGARSLLCSRCNGVWGYGRIGCPFCERTAEQTYYTSDDALYRLYVCDICRRYLKTIDLRMAGNEVCLPIESIITVAMDIAAQEKGYRHY